MNNTALKETVKTIARGIWFGLLGVVVLVLTVIASSPEVAQATVMLPIFNITLSVGALIVAGVAGLAKVIDRYIHKSNTTELKGIAPAFLQKQARSRKPKRAPSHSALFYWSVFILKTE